MRFPIPNRTRHRPAPRRARPRLLALEDRLTPAFAADGPEFQVNTTISSTQSFPDVALGPGGESVATWLGVNPQNGIYAIYAQRYELHGQPAGGEFQVSTFNANYQYDPKVGVDAAGNFVITWYGVDPNLDNSSYGVFARAYRADGTPLGNPFLVNTATPNDQAVPDIAMAPDGRFVIAWRDNSNIDGSGYGIAAQRYTLTDSGVTANGSNFLANINFTASTQEGPQVAMNAAGDFVVTWAGFGGPDPSGYGVYAQRFAADGTPVGTNTWVNFTNFTTNQYDPDVAVGPLGDFVVVWSGEQNGDPNTDPSGRGIYLQRFDPAGAPVGTNVWVNEHFFDFDQYRPRVARDDAGNTFVIWYGYGPPDPSPYGTFARRYDPAGAPVGDEFMVPTATNSYQWYPAVAMHPTNGDVFAVWASYHEGSDQGIFAQRYLTDHRPTTVGLSNVLVTEDAPDAVLNLPAFFADAESGGAGLTYTRTVDAATPGLFASTTINGSNQLVLDYAPDASGTATVTVRASDGLKAEEATFTVTMLPINDPPEATNDTATVTEDAGPQTINVLANDATGPEAGETLTVVAVSQPQHGTAAIGPGGLSVVYTPDPDYAGPDAFTYTVSDGAGAKDLAAVNVVVADDLADRLELATSPGVTAFTEGLGPVLVDGGIRVGSADEGTVTGATVRFAGGYVRGKDTLTYTPPTGSLIKGTFSPTTGAMTLTGAASPADYELALRAVKYTNPSAAPVDGTRKIAITLKDGSGPGDPVVKLLRVTGTNTKATLTPATAAALAYRRGAAPLAVLGTLVVKDADNTRLSGATVSIGAGFAANLDQLKVTTVTGIGASYDPATGVLTLTGNATLATYQTVLRSVKFATTAGAPTGPRTLSVSVTDAGGLASDAITRTVNVG